MEHKKETRITRYKTELRLDKTVARKREEGRHNDTKKNKEHKILEEK